MCLTSANKKIKEGSLNSITMYSSTAGGSAPVCARIGRMIAYAKFTGVGEAESLNKSATGSFGMLKRFPIMADIKNVLSSGGASGKKKAD